MAHLEIVKTIMNTFGPGRLKPGSVSMFYKNIDYAIHSVTDAGVIFGEQRSLLRSEGDRYPILSVEVGRKLKGSTIKFFLGDRIH